MGRPEVVYMFAMSLDGYIARADGAYDWLEAFPADADYDFPAFMASLSGIVMGRDSYDAARRDGKWDYGDWPVIVATRRAVGDLPANASAMDADPREMLDALATHGTDGRIWLFGGGNLARQFFDEGLLDLVEIGVIPVVLGSGIPAFGGIQADRWLDLEAAKPLKNGAVHLRYRVRKCEV